MNRRFAIAAVIATLGIARAEASLGETLPQTIARYGEVVKQSLSPKLPGGEAATLYEFEKNGFRIGVRFVGGKAAWMLYSKTSSPIFDVEIRTLLENNAQGSTWNEGTPVADAILKKKVTYVRADHLADAKYEELNTYHGLLIITKAWRQATSEASGL